MQFTKEPVSRILISQKICSQRCAKNFVQKNQVFVNGNRITDSSFMADASCDEIIVNGIKLKAVNHMYIMMNKPSGFVCSTVSDSHKTVYDLLKQKIACDIISSLKCVGRLDCDTSGLLLLSTNGSFVNFLTNPDNKITKTYLVKLRDTVNDKEGYKNKIRQGINVPAEKKSPGFITRSAEIKWIDDVTLEIIVTEGKFHEVRRIFSALGNFVVELKRLKIGEFELDDSLREGEFKIL